LSEAADAATAARRLADALEAAGIEYAIGGALALNLYSVPRATNDVDLALYISGLEAPEAIAALRGAGCQFDEQRAMDALVQGTDFGARCEGLRVDVFLGSHDLHWSAHERAVRRPLQGRPAWFLTAEDVLLFKVLWDRLIDRADVQRLIAVQGARLDLDYVRGWLARMFPGGDRRVDQFEQALRDHLPAAGG
jgi:hypothetical protein